MCFGKKDVEFGKQIRAPGCGIPVCVAGKKRGKMIATHFVFLLLKENELEALCG